MRMKSAWLAVAFSLSVIAVNAEARDSKAVREFKREVPCPDTGKRRGACPGYVVDHRIGLCVGGEDSHTNMRWMTIDAAKAKDRWECKPGWEARLKECEQAGCFTSSRGFR